MNIIKKNFVMIEQIVELQPDEPIDGEIWQQYLHDKREVFRFLLRKDTNIKSIGEIGVRSGYGAKMFMDNIEDGKYLGFDNCISIVGRSGMAWFKQLMVGHDAQALYLDSQKVDSLRTYFNQRVDFFHIDGCHMEKCVYHDIGLATEVLRPGGWILLDDWKDERVKAGFQKRSKEHSFKDVIPFEETLRGDLLVQV